MIFDEWVICLSCFTEYYVEDELIVEACPHCNSKEREVTSSNNEQSSYNEY